MRGPTLGDGTQNRATLKGADAAAYELEYKDKKVHANVY